MNKIVSSYSTTPICLQKWIFVSQDYADLNFAREFMLSGHPDYESFKREEKTPTHTRLHVGETIV